MVGLSNFYFNLLMFIERFAPSDEYKPNSIYSPLEGYVPPKIKVRKNEIHQGYRSQISVKSSSDRFGNKKSKRLEGRASTN